MIARAAGERGDGGEHRVRVSSLNLLLIVADIGGQCTDRAAGGVVERCRPDCIES